jgi:hypothetical protein
MSHRENDDPNDGAWDEFVDLCQGETGCNRPPVAENLCHLCWVDLHGIDECPCEECDDVRSGEVTT